MAANDKLNELKFDDYKGGAQEEFRQASDYESHEDEFAPLTPKEEAAVRRKVDLRLVVLVGFMYCVSLMDRTNTANANAAGMGGPANGPLQGLELDGTFHYNIISLVFFPTYIVFQIPSTVIVRALGPRVHLASITLLWGSVMIGMSFVKDWQVMAGMRVLLGVLEAGFFPSCVYLLSTWYTRYDMGKRYSLFYTLGCVASAFAGILAYYIMDLKGKLGLSSWRWIFLIEGLLTIVVAIIGYILLVGFPDHWTPRWHFLTEREVRYVIDKVNADRGDATPEPFNMRNYLRNALDLKIWAFAMTFFASTTISYALAYFGPDILKKKLHYNPKDSQIMGAPPYVVAGVLMAFEGWMGDRSKVRGPFIIFNMALCLIGFALLGWAKSGKVQYFSLFLVTAGANANIPVVMTYQANNIRGQWKRAFCSATLVGMGGVGGIAGSLVFREIDKPEYKPGLYACMTCAGLNIIIVSLLSVKFLADNAKAKAGQKVIEDDPGFLYTI